MASRKMKKPAKKHLERFRFNISTVKKGRNGYLVKTVRKLVRHIRRRLQMLTSKRRQKHQAARRLVIVIKYQAKTPIKVGKFPRSNRLKTYQRKIPLRTEDRQKHCQLNFWHELDTKAIQWRVVDTCCQIKRSYFRRAKYIGIKASRFIPLHLPRWIADTDPKELEHAVKKMEEQGLVSDMFPFVPMEQFERVLQNDSDNYQSNKIPVIRTGTSVRRSDINTNSRVIISKRGHGDQQCAGKKMRQTTIDEYFKPRGISHRTTIHVSKDSGSSMR